MTTMRITTLNPFEGLEEVVQEHVPLAPRTWYKIGGPARWFVEADSEDEIVEATAWARERGLALFVLGASDLVSVNVRSALIQLSTPDTMRGRVSAVSMLFIGASNELGEFESGTTAALMGTVPAVVLDRLTL